jgi:hypothetical protein
MYGKKIIGMGIDCFNHYVIAMSKAMKQSHTVSTLRAERGNLTHYVIANIVWQFHTNKI